MAIFSVKGPFELPGSKLVDGRLITKEDAKKFWETHPSLSELRGCYVFAFYASKGIKPMYVGKATKSFGQEVFTDHKRIKYAEALASQKRKRAVLFFVCLEKSKGAVNKTAIDEVESFLIQAGIVANKRLLNDRKTKIESWGIKGVIRGGKGKPGESAKGLKKCLNL